jgi:hypothetical protein
MTINSLLGYSFTLTSAVLASFYVGKTFTTKNLKSRYELINKYEIKVFRVATYVGIVGLEFLFVLKGSFTADAGTIGRCFLAFGSAAICFVCLHYFLKVYYPQIVEERLKVLRYTPRISPKTGTAMVLLRESEEDAYLDDDKIMDEDVHSVDYDVWIDKKSGHTQIEKYYGYKHAHACPKCGYRTLYILKEVIVQDPTPQNAGILVKHFKCKYCNFRFQDEVTIRKSSSLEGAFTNA